MKVRLEFWCYHTEGSILCNWAAWASCCTFHFSIWREENASTTLKHRWTFSRWRSLGFVCLSVCLGSFPSLLHPCRLPQLDLCHHMYDSGGGSSSANGYRSTCVSDSPSSSSLKPTVRSGLLIFSYWLRCSFVSTPDKEANSYYLGPAPLQDMARWETEDVLMPNAISIFFFSNINLVFLENAGRLLLHVVLVATTETTYSDWRRHCST